VTALRDVLLGLLVLPAMLAGLLAYAWLVCLGPPWLGWLCPVAP
jgi:hypothetical protein